MLIFAVILFQRLQPLVLLQAGSKGHCAEGGGSDETKDSEPRLLRINGGCVGDEPLTAKQIWGPLGEVSAIISIFQDMAASS